VQELSQRECRMGVALKERGSGIYSLLSKLVILTVVSSEPVTQVLMLLRLCSQSTHVTGLE